MLPLLAGCALSARFQRNISVRQEEKRWAETLGGLEQTEGETLPCLSQTGEGFLPQFGFRLLKPETTVPSTAGFVPGLSVPGDWSSTKTGQYNESRAPVEERERRKSKCRADLRQQPRCCRPHSGKHKTPYGGQAPCSVSDSSRGAVTQEN